MHRLLALIDRLLELPPQICAHPGEPVRPLCPKPCNRIHERCRDCLQVINGTCLTD